MKRTASVALAALVLGSCARPLMKLPSGPGVPATNAPAAIEQAAAACRRVNTLTAEIGVTGSIGGQRVRAQMFAGFAAPASARLEAVAAFGPLFVFVAQRDDATLLLPHDNRVLEHGPPAAILEAVAGVPLGPADLRTALTGCVPEAAASDARQLGDDWLLLHERESDVYLKRSAPGGPWQIAAVLERDGSIGEWRREYQNVRDGLPQTVRLVSTGSRRFDLQLALSQVDVNMPLGPEAFQVRAPSTAAPITLEELKASGPLSGAHDR